MWWMVTDGYHRLGAIACFREEDIAALAAKRRMTGRTGPVGSALDTTTILGVYNPPTTRISLELVMTETRLVVAPCRGAWCESAVGWDMRQRRTREQECEISGREGARARAQGRRERKWIYIAAKQARAQGRREHKWSYIAARQARAQGRHERKWSYIAAGQARAQVHVVSYIAASQARRAQVEVHCRKAGASAG